MFRITAFFSSLRITCALGPSASALVPRVISLCKLSVTAGCVGMIAKLHGCVFCVGLCVRPSRSSKPFFWLKGGTVVGLL